MPEIAVASLLDLPILTTAFEQAQVSIPNVREAIKGLDHRLAERFHAGEPVKQLIHARAHAIDHIVRLAWKHAPWPSPQPDNNRIALLAVGGYGREELHPHSDIDLCILIERDDGPYQAALSHFVTLLWDLGLNIGHGVRLLEQCVSLARDDLDLMTALVESRTLAGPKALHKALKAATAPDKMWPTSCFFEAKLQEQCLRYNKANHTEYRLEPNVKNSPGGLRDLQMMGWIAKRHFGITHLDETIAHQFMTEEDLVRYQHSLHFLWRLRYALHLETGREEDRLLFAHQTTIAEQLGYRDTPQQLAVEQMMRQYYRTVATVAELNDLILLNFKEHWVDRTPQPAPSFLDSHFEVHGERIHLRDATRFLKHPIALLDMFVWMARTPSIKGISARTLRDLCEARHLIDAHFRSVPEHRQRFMALLSAMGNVPHVLSLMARYGILGRYLPEFERVSGLMQYDLFHIYTVDAHTLQVLQHLQRFRVSDEYDAQLANACMQRLQPPLLMWIAGLFHDIGKGRGGDHSQLGAVDARAFCEAHGLSATDTRTVEWLVQEHLRMSQTSQKRDLTDPDVIREFVSVVGDRRHLDMLYVLTVADIQATNPTLWNGWHSALLSQLHAEACTQLERGLSTPFSREDARRETREAAYALLKDANCDMNAVSARWAQYGLEYFQAYAPHEIVWQTLGLLEQPQTPLVIINTPPRPEMEGGTQVFIHTPDNTGLFAATVNVFDQLQLSVFDARIVTADNNWTLNTFTLLDADGLPVRHPTRLREIHDALLEALADTQRPLHIPKRHMPRRLRHFQVPTDITITHEGQSSASALTLIAGDRPGLLARVSQLFVEFGLSITAAKITTLGERVEDVFFVTDAAGQPLQDERINTRIATRLRHVLDSEFST